jgi:RNA polymerase-binding transcription factor DksA
MNWTVGEPDVRHVLESERASALDRVQTLRSELESLAGDAEDANGDDEHDPEGSTLAFERARVAALHADAMSNLQDLGRAVAKLASGSYGVCEYCGKEIARARLEALPATRSCRDCATKPLPR